MNYCIIKTYEVMKIKWGAFVTDGRGKVGGHVASKNAAGAFFRTKVTPTNPNTPAQSAARALFGLISQQWSALTQAQRNAWNEAVSEWQTTNIFGDLKKPTGKALFQRLNNQAQAAGLSAVTDVPQKGSLPDAIVSAVTIAVGAGTLVATGADSSASTQVVIWGTAPLSQGTSVPGSKLRQLYSVAGDSYDSSDAYNAYVAKFGAPVANDNIFIAVQYVIDTGQASPPQSLKASVTA